MRQKIINSTRNTCLALAAEEARTFRQRLRGLIGRASLSPDEALILQPCKSVHTFFMRFPLDLVFLDRAGTVCRLITALPPGRTGPYMPNAYSVIELAAGRIKATGTETGDLIEIVPGD